MRCTVTYVTYVTPVTYVTAGCASCTSRIARCFIDVTFYRPLYTRYIRYSGLRQLRESDCEVCCAKLNTFLQRYLLTPQLSAAEFKHWMLPQANVVYRYPVRGVTARVTSSVAIIGPNLGRLVVELSLSPRALVSWLAIVDTSENTTAHISPRRMLHGPLHMPLRRRPLRRPLHRYSYVVEDVETKEITDMFSFYSLPSSILGNDKHRTLNAAYCYYYFANKTPLAKLVRPRAKVSRVTATYATSSPSACHPPAACQPATRRR